MSIKPPATATSRLPEFAQELGARMARVRHWRSVVIFATAGALAMAVVCASLLTGCLLDFLFALPWWVRALWLLVSLGAAGWLVWERGVRVQRQQPDDEAVALMIERGLPAFRSRFISAVQLARGRPTPLVRALVAETVALARTQGLGAAIDKRAMWRAFGAVAAVAGVGIALWFVGGPKSAPLLRRAVLSTEPAPRLTRLNMLTGHRMIGPGDDFMVEAGVSGVVPSAGRLHVKSATGHAQDFPLEAEAGHPTHFLRTLASVPEAFDYFVVLGDARSETFHVKVHPRPAIVSVEATQKFPAYTQLPPRRIALNELKLPAGSRLALRVKAGSVVKSGAIQLFAGSRALAEAPLTPDAKDAAQLAGEIAIPEKEATGLALRLSDADGLESRAGTIYPIDAATDQPPVVKIRQPARQVELLTPGGTVLLAFEARDDFGLAKIRLHYAVDWTDGAPSTAVELDMDGGMPREVVQTLEWKTAKLRPLVSEGQVIDYWLEALDTKEPAGIGTMEHYQVRMVSEFEKRADFASRLSEVMKSLGEWQQGEEDANAKLGAMLEKSSAEPLTPELLRESEAKQKQLAGAARKMVAQLDAMLDEYARNQLTGVDAAVVKKVRDAIDWVSGEPMQAILELLQKALAAGEPGAAAKAATEAHAGQKQMLLRIAQVLAEHGRQQEGREFSHALGRLAERQAANLQRAIEAGKRVSVKRTESLGTAIIRETLDEQMSEQAALAEELKAVAEKIGRFAKEPGHAEMTARFQQAATEAQRVQTVAEAAAAMLKQGQVYKAGTEEKSVHDAVRRLAKLIAPPLSPAEALHIAERDLGRMIAEETALATEAQEAKTPEIFATLESRQGRLATRSDLLMQDLATQAPAVAQMVRAAFEKIQETRAMLVDKASADASQQAQTALANLEKARGEIAASALRVAAPAARPVAGNAPTVAPQAGAAEKRADELAKIIEGQQRLELEAAKIVAQASPKMSEQFKGLDVRQADLRAQTGDVKTALAGESADAVDALNDAGRDMGVARTQLETGDGPGADATERKVLADLYRAVRALNRKIAQAGENDGAQTSVQLVQAQAALADAQKGFQKFDAARQTGQANARILQETAVTLAQAAQQAGRAAAGSRATGEVVQRVMQEAAQEAADATVQATVGHVAPAQEKAGRVQAKLAQAAIDLAQEQAGLVVMDAPPTSDTGSSATTSSGLKPGTPATADRALDFTSFSPRDRAALEQAQAEKYPVEYGALIEQYRRNLATESAGK